MLEANKVKLGLFVVFSVVVFFCVIAMLGVLDVLQPRVHVMTLFKESVQGMESGSPVKFRGVPIGKVSNIVINAKKKLIRVDMDIDLDKVRTESSSSSGKLTPQQFYEFIDREVSSGLRCRMEFAGITGLKYLEIDYQGTDEKPSEFLADAGLAHDGAYYIPSTPSLLSGLRTSLSDTLSKIASIDYKKIADELTSALESANKLFSDPRIREIIGHLYIRPHGRHPEPDLRHRQLPKRAGDKVTRRLGRRPDRRDLRLIPRSRQGLHRLQELLRRNHDEIQRGHGLLHRVHPLHGRRPQLPYQGQAQGPIPRTPEG